MTHSPKSSMGAYEARTHFAELLERVERGEEVTITRHGSPVATIAPIRKRATRDERRAAIARWRKTSQAMTLGDQRVRDLIDEGRA